MGKNTMMKRSVRIHSEKTGNKAFLNLIPLLQGNVGLIFTKGDLKEVSEEVAKYKVGAPARVGLVAPIDVVVPPGNTGLDPSQTSFFQVLNIPTKINKGTVEIITPVELIKKGEKVGSSEAALLAKLGIRPFSYGLVVLSAYDNGSVFSPEVLDLTEDDLVEKFAAGVSMIASLSLATSYPTLAAAPHMFVNAYKNVLAVAVATSYSYPEAEKVKEFLEDPSKFAFAAAPVTSAAASSGASAAAKEEEKKEEDDLVEKFAAGVSMIASLSLATSYPTLAAAPHMFVNAYKNVLAVAVATSYSYPEAEKVKAEDDLVEKFAAGVSMIASLSLATSYPTLAAAPHMFVNAYKNVLAVAVATSYSYPEAEKVKEFLEDPSKFAFAAAPVTSAAASSGASAAAKEEEKKEEDDLVEKFAAGVSMIASLSLATSYPTLAAAPHMFVNAYKNVLAVAVATSYSYPEAEKVKAEDDLVEKFAAGVSMIASLSLATSYPTLAAAPHMFVNAYKNVLAVAVATSYSYPEAEKVKEFLEDPSKFAFAAAPVTSAAASSGASAAAKEEEKKEEDDLVEKFAAGVSMIASLSLATSYPTLAAAPHMFVNAYKNVLAVAVATSYSYPEAEKVKAEDDLVEKFAAGVSMIASLSLATSYPTLAAAPHMFVNAYKNVLAVAVATSYSYPEAEKVKEFLEDPSKFAFAAAPVTSAAASSGASAAAKEEEKKEEPAEESDDDMGFGLFD